MRHRDGWPGAVAHRIGLGGLVEFTGTKVGQTLHVPCKRGNHIVDFHIAGNMPPDFVAKKMMQAGWTVGSKLICPDCNPKKRTPEMPEDNIAVALPIDAPRASPAAGKAKRLVYMSLEDYYDEPQKRYKPGHSDATIAKEAGISEAAVKAIREESYGPIGEPVDVTEFRDALVEFRKDIAAQGVAAAQAITALERRLDALVKKNGWAS